MNILIAGDSFAAKWPDKTGWVDMLAKDHQVINIAQAGVGEYKIFRQLEDINFPAFDLVIVSHTSPSRLHTRNHPLHKEGFHKDCDLIYTDLEDRCSLLNANLMVAKGWFEYHYDDDYQLDIYEMIREKINSLITVLREKINSLITVPYISLSHIPIVNDLRIEKNHIDFSDLWSKERGDANHYTAIGNKVVYETITNKINGDNL